MGLLDRTNYFSVLGAINDLEVSDIQGKPKTTIFAFFPHIFPIFRNLFASNMHLLSLQGPWYTF